MRPIDSIRERMDSDLVKYHASNLCIIDSDDDVVNIYGVGPCAVVRMFDQSDAVTGMEPSEKEQFPVVIINRPYGWLESNISKKYYIVLLNPVADRSMSVSMGFLVSKTVIGELEYFKKLRTMSTYKQASDSYEEEFNTRAQQGVEGGQVTLTGAGGPSSAYEEEFNIRTKQKEYNVDIQ